MSKKRKSTMPASEARDYFKEDDDFFICQIEVLAPKVPGAEEEGDEAAAKVFGAKIKKNIKKDGGKGNYIIIEYEFF